MTCRLGTGRQAAVPSMAVQLKNGHLHLAMLLTAASVALLMPSLDWTLLSLSLSIPSVPTFLAHLPVCLVCFPTEAAGNLEFGFSLAEHSSISIGPFQFAWHSLLWACFSSFVSCLGCLALFGKWFPIPNSSRVCLVGVRVAICLSASGFGCLSGFSFRSFSSLSHRKSFN